MLCTGSLLSLPEKGDHLVNTAKQYRDGSIAVENPREEAAEIFTMVRDTMVNSWAKDLADQVKVAAAMYNGLLMQRRFVYLPVILFMFSHS